MEVRGIEPPTRVVAQGLTPYCSHFVSVLVKASIEVQRSVLHPRILSDL